MKTTKLQQLNFIQEYEDLVKKYRLIIDNFYDDNEPFLVEIGIITENSTGVIEYFKNLRKNLIDNRNS